MARYGYGHLLDRPPRGGLIDRGHPLSIGLKWGASLNEGNGDIINDATGLGNALFFAQGHTPIWVPGAPPRGMAIQSDGINQFISTRPVHLSGNGFSLASWIYTTPDPTLLYPLTSLGFGLSSVSTGSPVSWLGYFAGATVEFFNGSNLIATSNIPLGTGVGQKTWYHSVIVIDAQKNVSFYLNGKPAGTRPADAFTNNTLLSGSFFVQCCSPASIGGSLTIDQPLIWDRALHASEAFMLYRDQWDLWAPANPR